MFFYVFLGRTNIGSYFWDELLLYSTVFLMSKHFLRTLENSPKIFETHISINIIGAGS